MNSYEKGNDCRNACRTPPTSTCPVAYPVLLPSVLEQYFVRIPSLAC